LKNWWLNVEARYLNQRTSQTILIIALLGIGLWMDYLPITFYLAFDLPKHFRHIFSNLSMRVFFQIQLAFFGLKSV